MCIFISTIFHTVPDTTERQYRQKLQQQSELISTLNHNITILKQRLQAYKDSQSLDKSISLRNIDDSNKPLPPIFMITPTYARWTQKADLTRLTQTLMHVQNLHWIVVEDSEEKTKLVTNFLFRRRNVLKSTHLNIRTEESQR